VCDVAKAQSQDIERYLLKEVAILDKIIVSQNERQDVEYARLWEKCRDYAKIRKELDEERIECVEHVNVVQKALGVETDPME
jgi:hypothetical protein